MLNFKMLVFCRVCEISSKTFQLLFSLWLLRNFKLLFLYPVTSILGRNLEGNGILKSMHIFIMKNNLSYQQNLRIIPCVYSVMSKSLRSMNCRHQAFLSMEFSRQEYWSGLPFPSPWTPLPYINPRIASLRRTDEGERLKEKRKSHSVL